MIRSRIPDFFRQPSTIVCQLVFVPRLNIANRVLNMANRAFENRKWCQLVRLYVNRDRHICIVQAVHSFVYRQLNCLVRRTRNRDHQFVRPSLRQLYVNRHL